MVVYEWLPVFCQPWVGLNGRSLHYHTRSCDPLIQVASSSIFVYSMCFSTSLAGATKLVIQWTLSIEMYLSTYVCDLLFWTRKSCWALQSLLTCTVKRISLRIINNIICVIYLFFLLSPAAIIRYEINNRQLVTILMESKIRGNWPKWKQKEKTNWSWEENLQLAGRATSETTYNKKRNLALHSSKVDKKDAYKVQTKLLPASLLSVVPWGVQKRGLTFCQKGVRRLQLTRRPLLLLVSCGTAPFWIMHITSDNVLFMTAAILFSECA